MTKHFSFSLGHGEGSPFRSQSCDTSSGDESSNDFPKSQQNHGLESSISGNKIKICFFKLIIFCKPDLSEHFFDFIY